MKSTTRPLPAKEFVDAILKGHQPDHRGVDKDEVVKIILKLPKEIPLDFLRDALDDADKKTPTLALAKLIREQRGSYPPIKESGNWAKLISFLNKRKEQLEKEVAAEQKVALEETLEGRITRLYFEFSALMTEKKNPLPREANAKYLALMQELKKDQSTLERLAGDIADLLAKRTFDTSVLVPDYDHWSHRDVFSYGDLNDVELGNYVMNPDFRYPPLVYFFRGELEWLRKVEEEYNAFQEKQAPLRDKIEERRKTAAKAAAAKAAAEEKAAQRAADSDNRGVEPEFTPIPKRPEEIQADIDALLAGINLDGANLGFPDVLFDEEPAARTPLSSTALTATLLPPTNNSPAPENTATPAQAAAAVAAASAPTDKTAVKLSDSRFSFIGRTRVVKPTNAATPSAETPTQALTNRG